jgi:DNA-binding PadR family transcriptional regulator
MEYIVLGMLMIRSMTIYDLNKGFEMGLSLIYAASYGNLQYAVKKLLTKKMIAFEERVENGRNKKIYHINTQGEEAFSRWMKDDINLGNIDVLMLAKVYFLGLVEDDNDKRMIIDQLLKAVDDFSTQLKRIQKSINRSDVTPEEWKMAKYSLSTLDYGIGSYKFAASWLQEVREQIG